MAFLSSAAGKLLGFFRIQAIALALGATGTADALLLSLTVLTLFDVVFVSGAAILTSQAIYVRRHARCGTRIAVAGLARSAALWTWLGLDAAVTVLLCGLGVATVAAAVALVPYDCGSTHRHAEATSD